MVQDLQLTRQSERITELGLEKAAAAEAAKQKAAEQVTTMCELWRYLH